MMRALTAEEADVIEAACEMVQMLKHGRSQDIVNARRSLEQAVSSLDYEFEGRWTRPTGV